MKNKRNRKAFTLIELLVVIAIIAVLAVVVILSLNPAELLRQARDSNRVSDMANLKSGIALYLADVASPSLGTASKCYTSLPNGTTVWVPTSTGAFTSSTDCTFYMPSSTAASFNVSTSRAVDSTGWVPVNFNSISSGAPLGTLPVDPTNVSGSSATAGAYFYSYEATGTVFKLATKMESSKYKNAGSNDVESTDGGRNSYMYEQGTSLGL